VSADGLHYKILPVAADGSPDCRLRLGDRGRPVTVLQQALLMCSNRGVRVDGTFSEDTRGALLRDQARQLAVTPTGVYDPKTARAVRWPWYDSRTDTFTGRCGQVADRRL
jgi:peptidoglycan hydrolase-like protein with peptidoglycan-binding domain